MHMVFKPSISTALLMLLAMTTLVFCKKKDIPGATTSPAAGNAKPLMVQTLIATPSALSADIEVPGTILANESTEIHPEVAGRLVELHIQEGSQVAQGALLAKLYDGDLQAQLRKLEVQLKIAEQTEKRQAELLKIQGISQQEYDLSLLQVLSLKADMDITRENIRKTEIRAPYSGKLGLKNISPGSYITPSTILTTLSEVNTVKVQFNVPERYGSQLRTGSLVSFSVDGSSKVFSASIIASEVSIDEATRTLAIRARVREHDAALIPGVFAKVRIVLGKNQEALLVPTSAIIPVGRKKQLYVYEAGKAAMREVTTGVRDSTNIQILTGIKAGDTVITSAILFLRPGLDVTTQNAPHQQ